jgi:hypothetical protein
LIDPTQCGCFRTRSLWRSGLPSHPICRNWRVSSISG